MTSGPGRAAVVGTTAWGTTLAILLGRNGIPTTLIARTAEEAARLEATREHVSRLPGATFPEALHVASGHGALADIELLCIAVPSASMRANLADIAGAVPRDATVVSATKGLEIDSGLRMSELVGSVLPGRPLAVLSGPNISGEVVAGLPSTTVVASVSANLEWVRASLHSAVFRVYTSSDVVGVELGGALKNIVAIAGGVVDALHYGDNAKAALITRGLAEITRLGVASGADPLTFQGLAGVGDAIATSYSPLSRNRSLGELLGGGSTLEAALSTIGETAEGARTIPAALLLASRLGVELPITQALHSMLYEGLGTHAAVEVLLGREPTSELRSPA
ncbi:MAG: NAD(P)-dependent glycerol-3-phosphate dehydrogenase [Dehalococcoidia bacterium]|nr:NAD(P)-dependent glycerol-3-phosphate dehydrogenase [Dehalococcoidia bacterium]